MMKINHKFVPISLRAAAEFDTKNSDVRSIRVLKSILNQTRQEIMTTVELKAFISLEDVEFIPINSCEVACELMLNISLTSKDLQEILNKKFFSFDAELYIMSKDVEIVERDYKYMIDSYSKNEILIDNSLSKEINKKLQQLHYWIEVSSSK